MDTLTKGPDLKPQVPEPLQKAGRRFGYTVAIAINLGLIYVVHNLLDWDWVPFLTADFDLLIGIVTVSLVASALVNLFWLAYDRPWFKSLCQLALNIIGLAVTVRTYRVFPFDFSGYADAWETLTRAVLIIALVAIGISTVVEVIKLMTASIRLLVRPD